MYMLLSLLVFFFFDLLCTQFCSVNETRTINVSFSKVSKPMEFFGGQRTSISTMKLEYFFQLLQLKEKELFTSLCCLLCGRMANMENIRSNPFFRYTIEHNKIVHLHSRTICEFADIILKFCAHLLSCQRIQENKFIAI